VNKLADFTHIYAFALVLALAMGFARDAGALPERSQTVITASAVVIVINGKIGAAQIPVCKGVETYLVLPEDIRALSVAEKWMKWKFRFGTIDTRFRLAPTSRATTKDVFHALIESASVQLSVMTYYGDADDAFKPRIVMRRAEYERMVAESKAGKQSVEDAMRARVESLRITWEAERDELEEMRDRQQLKQELRAQPMVPVTTDGCSTGPLRVCVARGEWSGDELELTLEVENTDTRPHVVHNPVVRDSGGQAFDPGMVVFERWATDEKGEVALIPPGGQTRVGVRVPGASAGDFQSLSLQLDAPDVLQPVVAAVDEWRNNPFFTPKSKAEIEEEKLEKAAKGRVSLHVQAMVGGIWLANPQDDADLDPTSVKGLGARVTYGFNRYVGFEADVVGAKSGESRFEDVDFNGQQGDLLRSAKLGRVTLGGVIRMGVRRYIPVVRVGLGLQGASHNAEFEVGGGRMAGPEVGFEFNLTWSVGAGLDIRLGDHFIAGATVSGTQLMAGNSRSIDAGVHLGYSWKP
jgi:opacity protein-like surface antigen